MLVTTLVVFPNLSVSHDDSHSDVDDDDNDEIFVSSKVGNSNKKSVAQLAKKNSSTFLHFLLL